MIAEIKKIKFFYRNKFILFKKKFILFKYAWYFFFLYLISHCCIFMFDLDFFFMIFFYIQPPILAYIIFFFTKNMIFNFSWFEQFSFFKKKKKSIKFFECSVYSRLINYYQYDIHTLIFCILFILYDVDLIFFFAEAVFLDSWSILDFFIFFLYFTFFILSFWYDFERFTLYWNF